MPKAHGGLSKITPERLAYHEAGHAVVQFFEERASKIKRATIVADANRGTLGHAQAHRPPTLRPDRDKPFFSP